MFHFLTDNTHFFCLKLYFLILFALHGTKERRDIYSRALEISLVEFEINGIINWFCLTLFGVCRFYITFMHGVRISSSR